MFSTTRGIFTLTIIIILAGLFLVGCNQNHDGANPVAAPMNVTVPEVGSSNLSFKLVFPQEESDKQSANILADMVATSFVTFQIKLLNYGNTTNPFFIISKRVPVVNASASVIFESLPTTTILGQIHIENGKIKGCSDFHGALDLVQGENTVILAPVGSLMPQDVVANALNEIISSSTLFLNAPQTLVSELNNIVSSLLLDSSTAYGEVINNFTNKNGLPRVELLSPSANQVFNAGVSITIIASATDLAGNISKVEFFQGFNKVGEALSFPFSCTWKPLSAGSYSLIAKAFDNNLAVGVSASVTVQVVSPTYTVTYNGNGNTAGSAPLDSQPYQFNVMITAKDNTGNLTKTGYTFAGWNTASNGNGTNYNPASTFAMGTENLTLYAKWSLIAVTSLSLDYSNLSMILGQSKTLIATILPNDAADKTVTWHSSNNSVATVNNGLIIAVAGGVTTITATSVDGQKVATCYVTVKDIKDFITLEVVDEGLVIIEGFITGGVFSQITNNSPESIELTSFYMYDGYSGALVAYSTNPSNLGILSPGASNNLGKKLNAVYYPTFKWTFTWNQNSYVVEHRFQKKSF
ncbi:MAG: Ig-like domain-containing protein [Candidatus Riflebacteria bacterium]|nr:Ig-like domain-containing protein [Candidatus Riflebacteria bacterium]